MVDNGQLVAGSSDQSVWGATAESSMVMLDSTHAAVTAVCQKGQGTVHFILGCQAHCCDEFCIITSYFLLKLT